MAAHWLALLIVTVADTCLVRRNLSALFGCLGVGGKEHGLVREAEVESDLDLEVGASAVVAVTKSMPALVEYDYVHATVLVRVSHYLTPAQAATYKTAADGLS